MTIRKRFVKIITLTLMITAFVTVQSGVCIAYAETGVNADATVTVGDETLPVYTLQKAGNDNECFVLLILGDGYTKSEQGKFTDFAEKCAATMIMTEPFCDFADKINIYAVPTVSNYAGISTVGSDVDTYFGVKYYGNRTEFDSSRKGQANAVAIEEALETSFLDKGADIMRIHVVVNVDNSFGSASITGNQKFSFASQSSMYTHGEASLHELGHSIGKLGDEYGRYTASNNTYNANDPDQVPWKDLLGFRGVGITPNGNAVEGSTEISYIPTLSCMMKETGFARFCEVCKLELVRNVNKLIFPSKAGNYYIAAPDVTIEHSKTGAIGDAYERCRIKDGNITAANGHNLEFRSIVQNLANRELRLGVKLEIIGANGDSKRSAEQEYVIKPLTNVYNHEEAFASVSAVIENVEGVVDSDKISGTIIDKDTGKVLVTDKTEAIGRSKVTIRHKIKDKDGQVSDMENVSPSAVYVPTNSVYTPHRVNSVNGYTYVGNSLNNGSITVTEDMEIEFYYRKDGGEVGTTTTVGADKKTFSIEASNIPVGSVIILAIYNGDTLSDVKCFIYDGNTMSYTTDKAVSGAKVLVWSDTEVIEPICGVEDVKL